jgi:aspartate/tyrosine/aromatic aminotransferase
MLAAGYNKEYLPIEGLDAFRAATVDLLLGSSHPAIKEVGCRGWTGCLRCCVTAS